MTRAHHLEVGPEVLAGNGGLGRYVLLPGSVDRAARIARRFDGVEVHQNRRRLDVHVGSYRGVDVAAVPTGMGCPSVDIVVNELVALGARRLVRVGTAGSMSPTVRVGDLVVATAAVRDEGTSEAYAVPGYPAVADPFLVASMLHASGALGLDDRVHAGVVHSKDSFFGREFGQGPLSATNRAYMDVLAASGVLASEMEAAHLFVLGSVLRRGPTALRDVRTRAAALRVGAVLAVIGTTESGIVSLADEQATEERLIDLALAGLVHLAAAEA